VIYLFFEKTEGFCCSAGENLVRVHSLVSDLNHPT